MKKPIKRAGRKGIALILSIAMVFTMVPALSFATENVMPDKTMLAEQTTVEEPDNDASGETATDTDVSDENVTDSNASGGSVTDETEGENVSEEADQEAVSGEGEAQASGEQTDEALTSQKEQTVVQAAPKKTLAAAPLKAAASDTLTLHVNGILNNQHGVNGHAVAYENTQTMTVQTKTFTAAGVLAWAGGKNKSAGGLGYTYTFLNVYVLSDASNSVVTAEDVSDMTSKTIYKVQYKGNGETVVTYTDRSTETFTDCNEIYVSPVYKAVANWYLNYYYVDRVSTGSGSWSNKDAVVEFQHTFKDPSKATPVKHYKFVNWLNTDTNQTFVDGDTNVYSSAQLKNGETKNVYIYAIWQPSVMIHYHVNGEDAGTAEDFSSLTVYDDEYTPADKDDIHFEGWYDKDGNRIDESTVYNAPAVTGQDEEVTKPAEYDVYARFNTTHTVKKVWDDENDKDGLRKDSVDVKLLANGEDTGKTATLTEAEGWQYTFEDLDAYDESHKLIEYTAEETTDFGDDYRMISAVTAADEVTKKVATTITNLLIPKITIKAADDEKVYDGTPLENPEVTITKGTLFTGDELVASAEGSATNVEDTKEGNNKVAEYKIMRGDEDVTDLYNITTLDGTLTITKADSALLGLTAENYEGMYDGQDHDVPVSVTVEDGTVISYSTVDPESEDFDEETDWSEETPTWRDVTDGAVTVYVKAENPNYETATTEATVTITKRKLVLTSASAQKTYDGTPLTDSTITVSGDGYAGEEESDVAYDVTGIQIEVGESDNTFDIVDIAGGKTVNAKTTSAKKTMAAGSTFNENNYEIEKVYGKLTVAKAQNPNEGADDDEGDGNGTSGKNPNDGAGSDSLDNGAKTGDTSEIGLVSALMLVSVLLMAGLVMTRRRREE